VVADGGAKHVQNGAPEHAVLVGQFALSVARTFGFENLPSIRLLLSAMRLQSGIPGRPRSGSGAGTAYLLEVRAEKIVGFLAVALLAIHFDMQLLVHRHADFGGRFGICVTLPL